MSSPVLPNSVLSNAVLPNTIIQTTANIRDAAEKSKIAKVEAPSDTLQQIKEVSDEATQRKVDASSALQEIFLHTEKLEAAKRVQARFEELVSLQPFYISKERFDQILKETGYSKDEVLHS